MAQRPPKTRPTPQLVSLSKETLEQIMPALTDIKATGNMQVQILGGIYGTLAQFTADADERARDAARNEKLKNDSDRSLFSRLFGFFRSERPQQADENTTIRGGVSRGLEKGIGGGLGLFLKLAGGGVGLATLGAGIGGFFSGLAMGDAAARKLGTGDHLVKLMENTAEGLSRFNLTNGAALAGILTFGALFMPFGGLVLGPLKKVAGMGAIGFGIGSFFAGLGFALEGSQKLGVDYDDLPRMAKAVGETATAFGDALSPEAAKALAALLGAGGLFALAPRGKGLMGLGKIVVGMTLIGAGIGGFMSGIAAAGDFTGFDGEGFAKVSKNIAEGLNAFDNRSLVALSPLFAAGALFGVAGPRGLAAGGMATLGITLMGAGIGGFVSGIAAAGDFAGLFGVDGSNMKKIMTNIAGGLVEFNDVDGKKLGEVGKGIGSFGLGLSGFLLAMGAATIATGITNVMRWFGSKISGTEYEKSDGTISDMFIKEINSFKAIDSTALDNINKLDGQRFKVVMQDIADGFGAFSTRELKDSFKGVLTNILNFFGGKRGEEDIFTKVKGIAKDADQLEKGSNAIEKLAHAFNKFALVKFDADDFDIQKLAENLGKSIPLLEGLTGGDKAITADYGGMFGFGKISFGKGLVNNKNIDLPGVISTLERLNRVLASGQSVNFRAQQNDILNAAMGMRGSGGGNVIKGGDYMTGDTNYITNNYVTNNYAAKVPASSTLVKAGHM